MNGAIFNSWESGNALSYGKWHWRHGLLSDFFVMGGSGGGGNVNEPTTVGVYREGDSYPAYAMGYSIVDAIYQGINYIAWQNDVIGDPLTTIAWGKQTLTDDVTWKGKNLLTGEVSIPLGKEISLNNNTIVNLRHNGFITGEGLIVSDSNYTINVSDWDRSLLKSKNGNYVKLIWGAHPTHEIDSFYVYKKYDSPNFQLIGQVDGRTYEYTDATVTIIIPTTEPKTAEYYVIAKSNTEQNDQSNTVSYYVGVQDIGKTTANNSNKILTYSLLQNYPNPFNPTTTIKYSLKDDGQVSLKIYNILGSEIAELVNDYKSAGEYSSTFDFNSLSSGTYFYVLRVNGFVDVKKMVLLK